MTLTDVTFTTEQVDDETRRVVQCTWKVSPFTAVQAETLGIRTLLFERASGMPKPAIDAAVLRIAVPLQRMTVTLAPDQEVAGVVVNDVTVDDHLRVKVKRDRDPVLCDATIKVTFRYPSAADLLYIANGVNDTHFLSFDAEQGALAFGEDEAPPVVRPGVAAEW
jgi:hypothetical protein